MILVNIKSLFSLFQISSLLWTSAALSVKSISQFFWHGRHGKFIQLGKQIICMQRVNTWFFKYNSLLNISSKKSSVTAVLLMQTLQWQLGFDIQKYIKLSTLYLNTGHTCRGPGQTGPLRPAFLRIPDDIFCSLWWWEVSGNKKNSAPIWMFCP